MTLDQWDFRKKTSYNTKYVLHLILFLFISLRHNHPQNKSLSFFYIEKDCPCHRVFFLFCCCCFLLLFFLLTGGVFIMFTINEWRYLTYKDKLEFFEAQIYTFIPMTTRNSNTICKRVMFVLNKFLDQIEAIQEHQNSGPRQSIRCFRTGANS